MYIITLPGGSDPLRQGMVGTLKGCSGAEVPPAQHAEGRGRLRALAQKHRRVSRA